MNASKTAVTTTDERLARRVHALHGDGVPPMEIAEICDVPRELVRDILSGRRLGPAVTGRAAPIKKRCPVCGQSLFSLPCLACELKGSALPKDSGKPVVIAIPRPQPDDGFKLRYSTPVRSAVGRISAPVELPAASMQRIQRNMYCDECGCERMESPSGCVCPEGHGRIFPRVQEIDRRSYLFTQRLRRLPVAHKEGRRYRVDGKEGLFRRSRVSLTDTIEVAYSGKIIFLMADR